MTDVHVLALSALVGVRPGPALDAHATAIAGSSRCSSWDRDLRDLAAMVKTADLREAVVRACDELDRRPTINAAKEAAKTAADNAVDVLDAAWRAYVGRVRAAVGELHRCDGWAALDGTVRAKLDEMLDAEEPDAEAP